MIQFYDSMKGAKVPFEKAPGETVKMYVCGPTVYDVAHLGHGRSAVAFDFIRRGLEFLGYTVEFAMNITDVEDKIIERARKEGITETELIERITPLYWRDYGALGVKAATHNPKATEFIEEMIAIIKTLDEKGHIYTTSDGVYFDIKTFAEYGKLSHQNLDELNAGARVEENTEKRNHQDFVLWKLKKEGEPFWPSPWGDGRPGWHIECSAMSATLLGKTFDIHGGGLDLKFPHHECEIAQSESANGQTFARYWMHNGYITVNEEKMSKSLGNFFTLEEIFKQYNPRVVRLFLLSAHYRSPIEFSNEALDQARATLRRLDEIYLNATGGEIDETLIESVKAKLENDFDSVGILALIFENLEALSKMTLNKLNELLQVLPTDFKITPEQQQKITERELARQSKDWTKADQLRNELLEEAIELEDGADRSFARPRV